jgi:hypothetical protein
VYGYKFLTEGRNLLIGNHYFSPDVKVDVIKNYLHFLENILNAITYCVLELGDFNVPISDWNYVSPSPNYHYYNKLKDDFIPPLFGRSR